MVEHTVELLAGDGNPAHDTLVAAALSDRRCLVKMLEEGSRDLEVMREFLERYVSHATAADLVAAADRKRFAAGKQG